MARNSLAACCLGLLSFFVAGCSSKLDDDLKDRSCSADGRCLPGYRCTTARICVPASADETEDPTTESPSTIGTGQGDGGRGGRGGTSSSVGSSQGAGGADDAAAGSGGESGTGSDDDEDPPEAEAGSGGSGGTPATSVGNDPPEAGSGSVDPPSAGSSGSTAPSAGAGSSTPPPSNVAGMSAPPPAAGNPGPVVPPAAGNPGPVVPPPAAGSGGTVTPPPACGDTSSDVANCGACGQVCTTQPASAARCERGACQVECNQPYQTCGLSCVNPLLNVKHCGLCSIRCNDNQRCDMGRCIAATGTMLRPAELEMLLAMFNFTLQDFADSLGVDVEDLGRVQISFRDLERIGITVERLQLVGISVQDLVRIGIAVEGRR